MNTSKRILHALWEDIPQLNMIEKLQVLFLVIGILIRRYPERYAKRQIQKSISRSK